MCDHICVDLVCCVVVFVQNKLKSSQKDKVRQFMIFTQSNEKTAVTCLSQNDWKLDVATDKFFQNPELYVPNLRGALDKKKLEQLYNRYRGEETILQQYIKCYKLNTRFHWAVNE